MIVSTSFKAQRVLLFAIFFSISFITYGQSISEKKAFSYADLFLIRNSYSNLKIENCKKITQSSIIKGYVFNLKPQGFILISSKDSISPVVGYSFNNNFTFLEKNISIVSVFLDNMIENKKSDIIIDERNPNPNTIGPLIKSLYGQVNCYDQDDKLINVANLFTPHNYAPGCVAVSLSTLLQYYKWPLVGMGSHTYKDKYGSSKGTYTADFENYKFDWDNILERYRYKKTNKTQREALGKLVYNTAVALDMDFEFNGSTSNVNRIPKAGEKYFRFITKEVPSSSFIFWKVVDSNLVHKIPVIFSISASNGAGHSIVCDGFKFENGKEYHHVNMGWWGNSNGWYKIKSGFKVGGYNKIDHGLIDFLPVPMFLKPKINEDSSKLYLSWKISEKITSDLFELQIKKDDFDWVTISDTLILDSFNFDLDLSIKEYSFRVRSKMNNKWYNDSWSNTVKYKRNSASLLNEELEIIKFYPNPCRDILNIELNSECRVSLLSLDGKVVYSKVHSGESVVSMKNIRDGIYILRVQSGLKSFNTKLVKIY